MSTKLKDVRKERTGWRDKKLDELLTKHKMSQPNSFLVTEYDHGKSVAIIEYKDIHGSADADERLVNYCKLRKNKEYYFIVLFDFEQRENEYRITRFLIYPRNDVARKFTKEKYGTTSELELNEIQFIKFLYQIRGNNSSVYYKKAISEYQEWFTLDQPSNSYKNIISSRHRNYAYDVPAADIDCIVCDSKNIPYLFIEYKANKNYGTKHEGGHNKFVSANISQDTMSVTDKAMEKLFNCATADLGDGCRIPLPVILVEYNIENDAYTIYAFNKIAKEHVKLKTLTSKEYFEYVTNPDNFKFDHSGTCPLCGGILIKFNGKFGSFYGCSNYKSLHCKYTQNKPLI